MSVLPSDQDVARAAVRAALLAALEANGATGFENLGLHGWRCQYPDSYGDGPCDCVEILLDDLVDAAQMPGVST